MKQRAIVAAVLGGLVAIVVLPLLILQYGRHNPSPPSLEDNPLPAIPGEILFFDDDGCIVRARASGESREVATCESATRFPGFLMWVDANTVGFAESWGPTGTFTITTVNLETGEVGTATVRDSKGFIPPFGSAGQESVNGERVSISETGEVTLLSGTTKREIADFDVARYRQPQFLTWSPDGEWMLLSYYDEGDVELWVMSRDGETKGTLTDDTRQAMASWWIDGLGAWPEIEVLN